MGLALKNCGRDILFSACTWGADNTAEWIRETSANMWRSTGDVFENWETIKSIIEQQEAILPYGGAGSFNDMDMLVVGMYGKGNVGLQGLNDTQYKTHFSIWALLGSPLMIGCDVRNMNKETFDILSNEELIKINQDADCRQVFKLSLYSGNNIKAYARNLENGDIAVGFFNLTDKKVTVKFLLDELGLPVSTGKTLEMHEVWNGETVTVKNGTLIKNIEAFDSLVYRCRVVDA